MSICPRCGAENSAEANFCSLCSAPLEGAPAGSAPPPADGESGSRLIPTANPPALVSYYLGLFSIFPFLGLFLAIPAVILGWKGLDRVKKNPQVHGKAHATIGLGCGGLSLLVWGGALLIVIISALQGG
ncbi:MAG: zinc ribbon domain-containing protein [Acidobacteriota bacterium]|nr:zinc ribbon domain-containing protein [Acidobacteriota bacterium]